MKPTLLSDEMLALLVTRLYEKVNEIDSHRDTGEESEAEAAAICAHRDALRDVADCVNDILLFTKESP